LAASPTTPPVAGPWPSDRALAARVAGGDDGAFAELAARHRPALVGYAARRLGGSRDHAEDAVQEALVRALRALRGGKLPEAPRAWLFVIVRNCCWDLARGLPATDALGDELSAPGTDPADRAGQHDRLQRVVAAIGELPASQRAVLVGRELEGRSYRELAERQRTTVGAVKSLLVRARRTLAAQPQLQAAGAPIALFAARLRRCFEVLAAPVTDHATGVAAIATVAVTALPVTLPAGARDHPPTAVRVVPVKAHVRPPAPARPVEGAGAHTSGRHATRDADPAHVVRACAAGASLDGRFTAAALGRAVHQIPDDVAQYGDCRGTIQRAWMRAQAADARGGLAH
jgi:RNA polymerase sigma-70 factor (ECF subfamily)